MFRFGFIRKTATVGALVGVSLLGVAVAQAAPPALSASLVDPSKDGASSIHIVKYKQNATNGTTENTGVANPAPTGDTIEGIKFTLQKVSSIGGTDISSLDYTKNASWSTLSGLVDTTSGQPKGAVVLDPSFKKDSVTNAQGKADFDSLNFGFYKVSESVTPTAPKGVSTAAPFYIVLPFSTKTNPSAWSYDPTVYPKNTIDGLTKAVNDTKTTGIGTEVTYTIKASLSLPKGKATTKYVISDPLNSRISYQSATVAFEKASTALTPGTDYDLTPTAPGSTNGPGGQKVVVTFKGPGFAKLAAAYKVDATDHVVVVIKGVLVKVTGTNIGEIPNQAFLIPDDNPKWTGDGMPSDTTPKVKTGMIKILKTSAVDATKLKGAQFMLFASEAEAKEANPAKAVKVVDSSNNVVTTVTTDVNGVATMAGIRVSEYENGTTATTPRKYYLVETVAPEGYGLLAAPIAVIVKDNATFTTDVPVKDPKTNIGLVLGNTGANGPVLFAIVGVLLLSGALALYVAKQRKRNRSEQ